MPERLREEKQRLTNKDVRTAMRAMPDINMVGSYQFRDLFIGQERPRKELTDIIKCSQPGTVVVVSEPLGAGKSAFLSMVRDDLIESGFCTFEESMRHGSLGLEENPPFEDFYWGSNYSFHRPEGWESVKPKVLFIEEFDRKARLDKLEQELARAVKFLRDGNIPVLVLSGDYSLQSSQLLNIINAIDKPKRVCLDPVTPDVLKKALALRIASVLKMDPDQIDMDYLISEDLLAHLFPNTDPSVVNMRDTLVLFQQMGDTLLGSKVEAKFTGYSYSNAKTNFSTKDSLEVNKNSKAWHYVHALQNYLRGQPSSIHPMSLQDLKRIYEAEDIDDFEHMIYNLASSGIFKSYGIPFEPGDDNNDLSLPYLPSQSCFLDAYFNPLPPKTPREVAEEEEINERKERLLGLRELLASGEIEQSVYDIKRNEVLGINEILDKFVAGKIDRETFTEQRQALINKYED